jgi:tol-pal system protein YbgF
MGHYSRLAVFASVVMLTGCGSNEVFLKKQAELEARLEQVVQAQSATNARVTDVSGMVTDLQAQLKVQALEVEQLKPGYRELKNSLETTSQKLEKLASEAAAKPAKVEPVVPAPVAEPPPPAPKPAQLQPEPIAPAPVTVAPQPVPATPPVAVAEPGTVSDPQAAYQKAFRLYMADKFTDALAGFEGFLTAYPSHEYAANAQYWIGECLYSLKNYEWSLAAFNKVVSAYPKSSKVPDALLKGAFALFSMQQPDKGREMLHRLVDTYPRSAAAAKAKERLGKERKK